MFTFPQQRRKNLLNKMDSLGIDEDNIPLLHTDPDDDDYDDYKTLNTSRTGEISFIVPGSTEKEITSTLWLKKKYNEISWLHCKGT